MCALAIYTSAESRLARHIFWFYHVTSNQELSESTTHLGIVLSVIEGA
jgi:hypothetical protein